MTVANFKASGFTTFFNQAKRLFETTASSSLSSNFSSPSVARSLY
ncbi:hypothetical protein [Gottfriedia solisilvae]|nr:hypothetical protein [Gottfriedia solisilvae]